MARLVRDDPQIVGADADGLPAGAVRLLACAGGMPVAGVTDALDDPVSSATTVSGDSHGATCSSQAFSVVKVMSCGQKSVERAGRPGRLTRMAAGGSVAKLEKVSVSGQPRSLAAAARASPAVSASTTQVRTTSPPTTDPTIQGYTYAGKGACRRLIAVTANAVASDSPSDAL